MSNLRGTPLHNTWRGMRERCNYEKHKDYHNYGGRGISYFKEWDDFARFAIWALANGFTPGLHLDRRDSDGDYTPQNCRFVTPIINMRNRRSNRVITAFGETKTMVEWFEDFRCVVQYHTLKRRLNLKWSLEEALTTPAVVGTNQTRRNI
jgi:hypothetical protein